MELFFREKKIFERNREFYRIRSRGRGGKVELFFLSRIEKSLTDYGYYDQEDEDDE